MLSDHTFYPSIELPILESFADRCAKTTGQTKFFYTLLQDKVPAKAIVEKLTRRINTPVYDDAGLPSLMIRIPRFDLEQVIPHVENAVHPMSQTSRGQVQYVWLSKYQNIIKRGYAYGLPDQCPRNFISYDEALGCCQAKGLGWHLTTNYEWAGIAPWSRAHGIVSRGNNSNESDCGHPEDTRTLISPLPNGSGGPALTGSGSISWAYDHTMNGIFDCSGSVAEWVGGLRMLDGKLLWLRPEYSAINEVQRRNSSFWNSMLPNGRFMPADFLNTLRLDYTCPSSSVGGTPDFALSLSRTYLQHIYEQLVPGMGSTCGHMLSSDFSCSTELSTQASLFLRAACVFPMEDACAPGDLYFRNYGETAALRGGHWYHEKNAGMFWLNLVHTPPYIARRIGLRCAWIPDEDAVIRNILSPLQTYPRPCSLRSQIQPVPSCGWSQVRAA